jgi:SHS2 domain-containing protein
MAAVLESRDQRPRGQHVFEEHTGEVLLRLSAPTLAELFAHAGIGLAELLAGDAPFPPADAEPERVAVSGRDCAMLLVNWLNELIYLGETRKRVYTELDIDLVSERELRAAIRGFSPSHLRTPVKAATLYRLDVERDERECRAEVVLDV